MIVLIGVMVGAVFFAAVCRNALKRFPTVFYVIAFALDFFVVSSDFIALPRGVQMYVLIPLQRCYLAFALFAIVMFIGVFNEDSKIRAYLAPVRAELSLLACILTLAHVARQTSVYIKLFLAPTPATMTHIIISIFLAVALVALMVILGLTSIKAVRIRISPTTWKKIQRFAYPFFALIFVHIALILLPSVLHRGIAATESLITYALVLVLYSILRIKKALSDRSPNSLVAYK